MALTMTDFAAEHEAKASGLFPARGDLSTFRSLEANLPMCDRWFLD
jgi:hypothetical protein